MIRLPQSILTPTQLAVVRGIAMGVPHKAIASGLGRSHKTVEYHRRKVREAIGISGTADLTRWAVAHGLVEASV